MSGGKQPLCPGTLKLKMLLLSLLGQITWIKIDNVTSPYELTSLEECVEYEVQVEANCTSGNTSGFTESMVFLTECEANINNLLNIQNIQLMPNPFYEQMSLEFQLRKNSDIQIQLFSTNGQRVASSLHENLGQGSNKIIIDQLNHLAAGVYFVKINISGQDVLVKKVLKY